jgi:predicted regulator of Ras-like GTPase activity (Roadblock/LC7/MglB family)
VTDSPRTPHGLPSEPAYLVLGERLRQRGQLPAAATVALEGLSADPTLAAGHDLLGRIRADQGDDAAAAVSWRAALSCEPGHLGALKGLAFLAFRASDFATAERHLESAVHRAPHDASLLAALDRVRTVRPATPSDDALGFDDPANGLLLADADGMRLSGGLGSEAPGPAADAAAAEAGGLLREASRSARLLGLGAVKHLVVESADARFAVVPVRPDAALLAYRTPTTPTGRLVAMAQRAASAAERWLEAMR